MKKVLITGITGMAGSHLADFILEEVPGAQIVGVKRWRSPMNNIAHLENRIQLIDCDLTDAHGCARLIEMVRPDYVFHLAAQSFVPDSWNSPQATIVNNVLTQLNLFEAIRRIGIDPKIQVALSSEEYGEVHENELPISEKNPLRPLSPYAVSKVTQDMLGYQYHQSYGLKVIRTRAFNHEGPRRGEVFVTSNFAKQVAEIELGLRPPVLRVGNLTARRDWTDVRDMARAYWLAVEYCCPGEDYVIASGTTRTVQSLVDLLLSMSKVKIDLIVDSARLRPSDVQVLWGDASKFMAATGWKPKYAFEDTISDLLNYWRERLRAESLDHSAPRMHTSA